MDWKALERHALSAEYEDIAGDTWRDFVENLKRFGILNGRKIVLHQGRVLDGWQLYRACLELDIKPQFRDLPAEQDPKQYVQTVNDLRRHESASAVRARAAKRRERVAAARANGQSTRSIADAENVSQSTILNDISVLAESSGEQGVQLDLAESDSGEQGVQLESESQQDVTDTEEGQNEDLLPETVVGKDGKKYRARKPKQLCSRCQRCERVGQPLPKRCPMCRELRGARKKRTPKKPDDAPAPVDAFGNEIPTRCRDAYGDPWIQEAIDFLGVTVAEFWQRRLADAITKRRAAYPFFNAKDFSDGVGFAGNYLDQLLEHLKDNRPAGVCPICSGGGCADCRMSGLVPRKIYEELMERADAATSTVPT